MFLYQNNSNRFFPKKGTMTRSSWSLQNELCSFMGFYFGLVIWISLVLTGFLFESLAALIFILSLLLF